MNSGADALDIKGIDWLSAIVVSLGQKQIPEGIFCIHLKFIILLRIGIWVDKDFKIVVVKDDGVALGNMSPDFITLKNGTKINVFVVPGDLCSGGKARCRARWSFNVSKQVSKWNICPEILVETTIKRKWFRIEACSIHWRCERNDRRWYTVICTHNKILHKIKYVVIVIHFRKKINS